MKKIDLEKLERKVPYELPSDFFQTMQANVLKSVGEETKEVQKPKAKILPMRFAWAVAASFALILGLSLFYWNYNSTGSHRLSQTEAIADNVKASQKAILDQNYYPDTVNEANDTVSDDDQSTNDDSTFNYSDAVASNKKGTAINAKGSYQKPKAVHAAETNFDNAVNKLSSQELAEQSKKYEIDTYLDLY